MNREDFKQAFRESMSSEFVEIPCSEKEIVYAFSSEFENKMDRLLQKHANGWHIWHWSYRRIAVIVLLVLSMCMTACSVDSIREPIIRCIVEIYEGFQHYFFQGDTTKEITKEYELTEVPSGFEQIEKLQEVGAVITIFQNEYGDRIEFSQFTTENTEHVVNKEVEVYQALVSDMKVEFRVLGNIIEADWIQDEYFLNLMYVEKKV